MSSVTTHALLVRSPYGIGYQSAAKRGRRKRAIAGDGVGEYEAFLARALPAMEDVMKRGAALYLFCGGGGAEPVLAKALLAVSEHFDLLNTLVWDKVDPGLGWRWRRSWEAIIEASVGKPRVWHGGTEKRNVVRYGKRFRSWMSTLRRSRCHCWKRSSQPPHLRVGSCWIPSLGCTTLIAAERTGRVCYAAELEPRYCDIILARWEACSGSRAAVHPAIIRNQTTRGR